MNLSNLIRLSKKMSLVMASLMNITELYIGGDDQCIIGYELKHCGKLFSKENT